jgi:hypothetical protein
MLIFFSMFCGVGSTASIKMVGHMICSRISGE